MYYVLDENNNKIEALDKEGVLAAIEEAIANGSLAGLVADAAFISKVKCCVSGQTNKLAFVTQAKYNEMQAKGELTKNCYYYITDDETADDIDKLLDVLIDRCDQIEERLDALGFKQGAFVVASGSTSINTIKKQGKYVIASFIASKDLTTVTVPAEFRPKEIVEFKGAISGNTLNTIYLLTDGTFSLSNNGSLGCSFYNGYGLLNIGWELA